MNRLFPALVVAGLTAAGIAPAKTEQIVSSLSSRQVLITSSYTGTELVLFGAVERDAATVSRRGGYDLVVTVIGPRQTLVTRKKDRLFGIWANAESRAFVGAPSYLAVLSNRPLDQVAPPDVMSRLEVGLSNVPFSQETSAKVTVPGREGEFRAALIQIKSERGLYREEANAVTFVTPTLFRTSIVLPAEAPLGVYEVDLKLFADGTHVGRTSSALEIVKAGIEQFVANAAREHAFLYGLAIVIMALSTGWLASVIFQRD